MGIRFYCPNGHKLNVKAELAGKTGFCPECGARLQIPYESTRPSSHQKAKETKASSDENLLPDKDILLTSHSTPLSEIHSPRSDSSENPEMVGAPKEEGKESIGSASAGESIYSFSDEMGKNVSASTDGGSPQTFQTEPVSEPIPPQSLSTPVYWHVQGSDRQTYGPIDEATVKTWIRENRVGASSLVWREGWEGWKEARNAVEFAGLFDVPFPSSPLGAKVPPPIPNSPTTPSFPQDFKIGDGEGENSHENRERSKLLKKKKKAFRDMLLVIGLVVMIRNKENSRPTRLHWKIPPNI